MRRTAIPNTELEPSVICFGTAYLGSAIERDTAFRLLDAYLEAGGTFIDTAHNYADWLPGPRSRSEKLIGEWLVSRRARGRVVLATKGGHPELCSMHLPRMTRADILADLDASLANLRTDAIDLYWLHRDDESTPVEAIVDLLDEQRRAGKIRYFACSNWSTARIEAAQAYATRSGRQGFVANQMMWNAAHMDARGLSDERVSLMDGRMWDFHRSTGLAAIPYSSQASGLFSRMTLPPLRRIKVPLDVREALVRGVIAPAKRAVGLAPRRPRVYPRAENRARFACISEIAERRGLTITQVVLGYLISQPFVTVPIVGCRTEAQLQDSLAAVDVQLTPADLEAIESAYATRASLWHAVCYADWVEAHSCLPCPGTFAQLIPL
jgi:aryl-alcohol dehydrogenase-like predicted oxidoreductase